MAILVCGLLVSCGMVACGRPGVSRAGPAPVLVIGIDGLEWNILLPLMEKGELPHLSGLMSRGVAGSLQTLEPTLSPVIWTTMATGKPPAAHGITEFTWNDPATGEKRLFTSRQRRVPAIWTIASAAGRTVDVAGWWNTWPAEEINGRMVSQYSSLDQGRRVWKGTVQEGVPGQTWPPELYEAILPTVRSVAEQFPEMTSHGDLAPAWKILFPSLPAGLTRLERRLVEDSIWAFRADATYTAISEEFLKGRNTDLTLVYLGSPDVAGHRFFRHYRPGAYTHPPRETAVAAFGDVIPATYRFVDSLVGRLLAAASPGTNVIVVSDHGMQPVNTDKDFEWAFTSSPRYHLAAVNSGHHLKGEPGVLIAAGPAFRQGSAAPGLTPAQSTGRPIGATAMPRVASVFDLAPTLLILLDLPVGSDMPGVVLSKILATLDTGSSRIHYTPSYDQLQVEIRQQEDQGHDTERLRQLRSLGYVE